MSVRALDIPVVSPAVGATLHVLYGSQTGNGEAVAAALADSARGAGLEVTLKSLADLRPAALKKISHAAFIISTHGDGDPPDDALDVFEWLESSKAQDLAGLNYRVLSLGDRSYSEFCAAGRQLAALLGARGASAFAPPIECDVDYSADAERWSGELLEWAQQNITGAPGENPDTQGQASSTPPASVSSSANPHLHLVPSTVGWTRARPFPALVERVQKITGLESTKDVYHIELSLEGSGIRYQPGDSLGVWADNDPELVARLLRGLGIDPAASVDDGGRTRTIRETLTRHREITRLTPAVIESWAARDAGTGRGKLGRVRRHMDSGQMKAFMEARQFIDLAEAYPLSLQAQDLADLLPSLGSRSYSIASSAALVDEELHLTVATLHSNAIGVERQGVASQHLNHRLQPGDEVRVFLEPNRRFRLPEDERAPLIMIGAGTGIAPFRAFMQELEARGNAPDSWLIFGNPHRRTDFLYQREWLRWRSDGLLKRIDVAFSRDQDHKRYVQHVVAEQGAELVRWLDRGAHIYLCGALAMGHAVETALAGAIAAVKGAGPDVGAETVKALRRERRLLKDLY